MSLKFWSGALVLCLSLHFSTSHEGHEHHHGARDSSDLNKMHNVALKVCQGVDFSWVSKNETWVTMEMSSFTKGYVSIGFCPEWKGTMEACDIVVGWVSNTNGTAYLYDYYSRGNTFPELDESQDYELLEGKQEMGVTTIKFRRKWNTGDSFYDANLETGKVRIMWAWHPEDPISPTSYFKHAGNSRGHMMFDVSLKNPESDEVNLEKLRSSANVATNSTKILITFILLGWVSTYMANFFS